MEKNEIADPIIYSNIYNQINFNGVTEFNGSLHLLHDGSIDFKGNEVYEIIKGNNISGSLHVVIIPTPTNKTSGLKLPYTNEVNPTSVTVRLQHQEDIKAEGLEPGWIALIIIAIVVVVAAIVITIILLVVKKKDGTSTTKMNLKDDDD